MSIQIIKTYACLVTIIHTGNDHQTEIDRSGLLRKFSPLLLSEISEASKEKFYTDQGLKGLAKNRNNTFVFSSGVRL